MQIGGVKMANPLFLAPMAGVTDKAFRLIARRYGCALVYTEMISARALVYQNKKTRALLDLTGEEPPLAVQLLGGEPLNMARAAEIAQKAGAQIIDLNFGCPTPKIVNNGAGAALLKQPHLAVQIVEAVRRAVTLPVTVKLRAGWDKINVREFAQRMEDAGVSALTIHGRTREQYYQGSANWDLIKQVKNRVKVPVIGNGDLWTTADARRMLKETGCDALMFARGVLGNPWLFRQVNHFLKNGEELPAPIPQEKIAGAIEHLELAVSFKGEVRGLKEMRKHLVWYLKGLPHTARLKEQLFRTTEMAEVLFLLRNYQEKRLSRLN
jgi:tRNA-dihydrouridine synthase B